MQTYNFIKSSRPDFVDINMLSPLSGTPIWEYAVRRNLVSDIMDWGHLNFKFNKNGTSSLILSETLTHKQLYHIFKKFRKLRFLKTLKALARTPWLSELPKVAFQRVTENILQNR